MEEEIRDIFEKLPQDCGCPRAGKRKKDLDRYWDAPDKLLGVCYRRPIEICDRNASHEMRRYVQRGVCLICSECLCSPVDNIQTNRSPGGFAQGFEYPVEKCLPVIHQ